MKKICILFTVLLMSVAFAVSVNSVTNADDFEYVIKDEQIVLIKYIGTDTQVNIPSYIDGYPVEKIGFDVFFNCHNITNITIPKTVKDIEFCALHNINSIKSVNVDSENLYYSSDKFGVLFNKDKSELIQYPAAKEEKSYTIPNTVKIIEDNAFTFSKNLKSIVIPNSVTYISESSFYGCSGLETVTMPANVTPLEYGNSVFEKCENINELIITKGTGTMRDYERGWGAYYYPKFAPWYTLKNSVKKLIVSKDVQYIGNYAFYDFVNLEEIVVEGSTNIGKGVFGNCNNIASIYYGGSKKQWEEITSNGKNSNLLIVDNITFNEDAIEDKEEIDEKNECNHSTNKGKCKYCECYVIEKNCELIIEYLSTWNLGTVNWYSSSSNLKIVNQSQSFIVSDQAYYSYKVTIKGSLVEQASVKIMGRHYIGNDGYVMDTTFEFPICVIEHKEHRYQKTSSVSATCTESGEDVFECECGDNYKNIVPVLGHDYINHSGKEPICTDNGFNAYRTCSRCKYSDYTETPAKGHKFETQTTKATLKSNGSIETKCVNCGVISNLKTIYQPTIINLSETTYVYDGKKKTPKVTIKDANENYLKKDVDYEIENLGNGKDIGKHYVIIKFINNYSGSKKIAYSIKFANPTIKMSTKKSTAIISWNKIKGADGYQLYYSSKSNFDGSKKITIKDVSTIKKTIKKLSNGKKYYFKVRPYKKSSSGTIYGSYSKVVSGSIVPAAPKISVIPLSFDLQQINWNRIKTADGYVVYRKSGDSYKKIATIKSNKTTSYVVENLKENTKYTYTVKSYYTVTNKNYYSSKSNEVSSVTLFKDNKIKYSDIKGTWYLTGTDDVSLKFYKKNNWYYMDSKNFDSYNGNIEMGIGGGGTIASAEEKYFYCTNIKLASGSKLIYNANGKNMTFYRKKNYPKATKWDYENFLKKIDGYYWYLDGYENTFLYPQVIDWYDHQALDWSSKHLWITEDKLVAYENFEPDLYYEYERDGMESDTHNTLLVNPIEYTDDLINKYNITIKDNKMYMTIGGETYSFTRYKKPKEFEFDILVSESKVYAIEGSTFELDFKLSPFFAEEEVVVTSSNNSIVSLNSSKEFYFGEYYEPFKQVQFSANKKGITKITFTGKKSGIKKEIEVIVNK